jgi:chaperonin GroES
MNRLLSNKVLVELISKEEKSLTGIVISSNKADAPKQGRVVRFGPGKIHPNGMMHAMTVVEGDVVIFGSYAGQDIEFEGKKYLLMTEDDIYGII